MARETTSVRSGPGPPPAIGSGRSGAESSGAEHTPQRPRVEHDGRYRPERDAIAAGYLDRIFRFQPGSVDEGAVLAVGVREDAAIRLALMEIGVELRNARMAQDDVLVQRSADRHAFAEDRVYVRALAQGHHVIPLVAEASNEARLVRVRRSRGIVLQAN